ncbi:hypothetical protein DL93DRAFT_617139 [Clavulina sp. PMI_390]|nr:hypothetical protein DL93DRAFT_617139 [Clavulina sp. PMI_390]
MTQQISYLILHSSHYTRIPRSRLQGCASGMAWHNPLEGLLGYPARCAFITPLFLLTPSYRMVGVGPSEHIYSFSRNWEGGACRGASFFVHGHANVIRFRNDTYVTWHVLGRNPPLDILLPLRATASDDARLKGNASEKRLRRTRLLLGPGVTTGIASPEPQAGVERRKGGDRIRYDLLYAVGSR